MRLKSVADGRQVDIPVLVDTRTVGTHEESMSGERKNPYKRGSSQVGKAAWQCEDVTWTEKK